MDKKTILAVVLSLGVLLIYQMFFAKPPAPSIPAATPSQQTAPAAKETVTKPAHEQKISTAKG